MRNRGSGAVGAALACLASAVPALAAAGCYLHIERDAGEPDPTDAPDWSVTDDAHADAAHDTADPTGADPLADAPADGFADPDVDPDVDPDIDPGVDPGLDSCEDPGASDCVGDPPTDAPADGPVAPEGFVAIPAGTFTMGSPLGEAGRHYDEAQHSVTLTGAFGLMAMEVTQDRFFEVMGYRPSHFGACGGSCPVESLTWHEAAAYTNALSAIAGLDACYSCSGSGLDVSCAASATWPTPYDCPGFRLPTEAEWEYAARAGTTTSTYNGDMDEWDLACNASNFTLSPIGWYCGNSDVAYEGCEDICHTWTCDWPFTCASCSCSGTHPAAEKAPNAWGLYDMLGNAWEWCHDWYAASLGSGGATDPWGPASGYYRAGRGGAWTSRPGFARSACRTNADPGGRDSYMGLRVAISL